MKEIYNKTAPVFSGKSKTEKWAIRFLWICAVYLIIKTIIDLSL